MDINFIIVKKSKYIYAYNDLVTIRKDQTITNEWEVSPLDYFYFTGDFDRDDYIIYSENEAKLIIGSQNVIDAKLMLAQLVNKIYSK